MLKKLIFIAVLAALAVPGVLAKTGTPTAEEILKKTAAVYASCNSYIDTGTETTVMSAKLDPKLKVSDSPISTFVASFSTAFERPDRLILDSSASNEITKKPVRSVFWVDGNEVHSWQSLEHETKTAGSIREAFADPSGSGESAYLTPKLLLPRDVGGWAVTSLQSPLLMGSKSINGVSCFVVRGKTHAGAQASLCIDKKTYLILKAYESRMQDQIRIETTTTYEPRINVGIPATVFSFTPPVTVISPESIPARDIIAKMAAVYASCKSYRDTGTVTSVMSGSIGYTDVTPFNTVFVEPDRLRFEFSNTGPSGVVSRFVIWPDGKKIRSWWTESDGKVVTEPSICMAISKATGISSGSAQIVPRMLMPDDACGWSIANIEEPRLAANESVDGVDCFVIKGKDIMDSPTTLYIDKKTYLLTQIVVQRDLKIPNMSGAPFHDECTTKYKPQIDANIPDAALTFTPPK